eukprot:14712420-Ditylum_brightwellii.AAC.1
MSTKLDAMSVLMHDMNNHIMGQATKNPKEKEPEEGSVTTASQGSKRAANNTHFKDSLKWPVHRLISE